MPLSPLTGDGSPAQPSIALQPPGLPSIPVPFPFVGWAFDEDGQLTVKVHDVPVVPSSLVSPER